MTASLCPLARAGAIALLGLAASGTAAAVPLSIPAIPFQQRLLTNGLQVITVENHDTPNVAIQVWYHVGSKDDPPGRSGFAHLFEHLMFKSTRHLPAEAFDRLTEDVGGANNATTADDRTNYFEVVPSNHLQRLLWAEAERLQNLNVDAANFHSERAVVEEEYRQRILAAPYGRFDFALQQHSYLKSPYRRPTIGRIDDLEAASLADVIAFHQRYYRPDNATLIVVGDFDPGEARRWIDQYFGRIPRPDTPVPQPDLSEPLRSADLRVTVRVPNVPLPAVGLSWLAPPTRSPDIPALRVATALLGQGESSRLYQALVYRQHLAVSADFDFSDLTGGGLLIASAVLAHGHAPAEAEQAVRAEIARLARDPIPEAELDKARTGLLTQALRERETDEGLGFALGDAVVATGDPATANTALQALQKVSAADVRRVVRRYLGDAHPLVLDYLDQPAAGATK